MVADSPFAEEPVPLDPNPLPSSSLQSEANTEAPLTSVPPHVNSLRSRRSSSLLAASRLSQLDWSLTGAGIGKRKEAEGRSTPDVEMAVDGEDAKGGKDGLKGKGKERASPAAEQVSLSEHLSDAQN